MKLLAFVLDLQNLTINRFKRHHHHHHGGFHHHYHRSYVNDGDGDDDDEDGDHDNRHTTGKDVAHLSYLTEKYGHDMSHDIELGSHEVEAVGDAIEGSSMRFSV